jgi:hypothetical protein
MLKGVNVCSILRDLPFSSMLIHSAPILFSEVAEKVIFLRLLKNAQMQGPRIS